MHHSTLYQINIQFKLTNERLARNSSSPVCGNMPSIYFGVFLASCSFVACWQLYEARCIYFLRLFYLGKTLLSSPGTSRAHFFELIIWYLELQESGHAVFLYPTAWEGIFRALLKGIDAWWACHNAFLTMACLAAPYCVLKGSNLCL